MTKQIFTYLLTLILLCSVAIPSYVSITEDICETSLLIDIEDENDGNESAEKSEIKIIFLPIEFASNYTFIKSLVKSVYQLNQYNSIYRKLEPPPPEHIS